MITRDAGRRYGRRFVPAMIGYLLLLFAAIMISRQLPTSPWRYLIMAVPVLPLLLVVRAVARYLAEADELQRRIQLEALAFAFGTGSVLTFGYGLLQTAGAPVISYLWVWPVYAVSWVLGLLLARRRY